MYVQSSTLETKNDDRCIDACLYNIICTVCASIIVSLGRPSIVVVCVHFKVDHISTKCPHSCPCVCGFSSKKYDDDDDDDAPAGAPASELIEFLLEDDRDDDCDDEWDEVVAATTMPPNKLRLLLLLRTDEVLLLLPLVALELALPLLGRFRLALLLPLACKLDRLETLRHEAE
jgi:hypothetical protein